MQPKPVRPTQPDHYHELGLEQSATPVDIKKAYHKMALRFHPDRVTPGHASAVRRFQRVNTAYETLADTRLRAQYDETYSLILFQWQDYDRAYGEWEEAECKRQQRQRTAAQRHEDRENRQRRRTRERERREAGEARSADEQIIGEERAKETENIRRAADEEETLRKQKEEHMQRRAAEIRKKAQIAQKWKDAQERTRKVLQKAHEEQVRAAEQRLREREERKAEAFMQEMAKARVENERLNHQQQEEEREAVAQWRIAIEHSRAADERQNVQDVLKRHYYEQKTADEQIHIAAEWTRAAADRKLAKEDDDAKPGPCPGSLQEEDYSLGQEILCQQAESEAAENFLQEIMRIRGQHKADLLLLKDATLVFLEAIDLELRPQRGASRKRTFALQMEDPNRLPALVEDIFKRLDAGGEEMERFRFNKRRRT